jgi:molecular chaperone GrpE
MATERKQHGPAVAPGEPEAPVADVQPPAPSEPQPSADETAPTGESAPAEETEPEDHEVKLEQDLNELAARAEKADEYLELAQRTKADFENYRKRAAREAAAAQERGVAKLARELLPAVDNLDRALAATQAAGNGENGDGTLVSGIKLVHADVIAALARVGIERYSPEGEQFDPQQHEAVAQQPVDGAEPGTIVEVYQRGYRLGESVLRPARVVVAG